MNNKKIVAGLLALSFVFGGSVLPSGVVSNVASVITAQATTIEGDCFSFDEVTGTLTLRGNVDKNDIRYDDKFGRYKVKSVVAEDGTVFPQDSSGLFYGFNNCESIDLSGVDTSKVTNMSGMFENCTKLTELKLNGFDTSKVENMYGMFRNVSNLKKLDLSGFDTSNVTDMGCMFFSCENLESIDLSSFDTSNVTNMRKMFISCSKLESINLSSFDTSNVQDMQEMFSGCIKLTSLDVSGFDTSKVANMSAMFCSCASLTSLDVSGFDTSKVTNMNCMFTCKALTTLDLSSFNTSSVTDMGSMFSGCANLKKLTLGKNFKNVTQKAALPNGDGWVNAKEPSTVVSGDGVFAVIENEGNNTYKLINYDEKDNAPTYPTNIKVDYSEQYHQIRFTWDKVDDAQQYGIAVYLAGKWRVQTQKIPATSVSYTTPKNLTPGKTYKVAIAARVNGQWDVDNAIKNAVTVTVK